MKRKLNAIKNEVTNDFTTQLNEAFTEDFEKRYPNAAYEGAIQPDEDELDYARFSLKGVRVG